MGERLDTVIALLQRGAPLRGRDLLPALVEIRERLATGEQAAPTAGNNSQAEHRAWKEAAERVLACLHEVQGRQPVPSTQEQRELVYALLNEDFAEADLKQVIRHRWSVWRDSAQGRAWMTAKTIFNPARFPDYLAQSRPRTAAPAVARKPSAAAGTPPTRPEPTPAELVEAQKFLESVGLGKSGKLVAGLNKRCVLKDKEDNQ